MSQINIDFLNDCALSYNDKFTRYYEICVKNMTITNLNHHLYEGLNCFNEKEIDMISKLNINKYMFFRYLPNIHLIEKYYNTMKDFNAFHGITQNINITKDERTNILRNILSKKYL